MLEMLKERKAALEAQGKKGFTLMEMLIVIAIIAILIAIAIPIFTQQLDRAAVATASANVRSAYAEVTADKMLANPPSYPTADEVKAKAQSYGLEDCTVTIGTDGKVSVSKGSASEEFNINLYNATTTGGGGTGGGTGGGQG